MWSKKLSLQKKLPFFCLLLRGHGHPGFFRLEPPLAVGLSEVKGGAKRIVDWASLINKKDFAVFKKSLINRIEAIYKGIIVNQL